MESKYPHQTFRIRGMSLNLCILRMFEDAFMFGAAHIKYHRLNDWNRLFRTSAEIQMDGTCVTIVAYAIEKVIFVLIQMTPKQAIMILGKRWYK